MDFISHKISEEGITKGNYWPCEVNGPLPCLGLWNLLASHPSILEMPMPEPLMCKKVDIGIRKDIGIIRKLTYLIDIKLSIRKLT